MTPAQTQLASHRLRLGVTNVGFWVLAACAGLYCVVTGRAEASGLWAFFAIGFAVLAVQSVFDFIGGVTLMPGSKPPMLTFLREWARGVLCHTLVLCGVGFLSAISLKFTGGFSVGIVLATVALALGRRALLHVFVGVAATEFAHSQDKILTSAVKDPAFTGGTVGLGRRAMILIPASWLDGLPKPELDAELWRRRWQIANSLPVRALVLILLWNLLGAFIGTHLFQLAERSQAVALLGHACWMTLWAFASLLAMPALSRRAVYGADRAAADSGHDPRAWIARFPGLVGEDGSPNALVQAIFYPNPSAEMRLRQLAQPSIGFVPGNLARSNLYYSWATFTLLGRAVHCNVGRPALWVFPPTA